MPGAMNIDGPTFEIVAVRASLDAEISVLKMLQNLQSEQAGLNEHSHAPYFDLPEALNQGDGKDGDAIGEILGRQIFNWLPGRISAYKSL